MLYFFLRLYRFLVPFIYSLEKKIAVYTEKISICFYGRKKGKGKYDVTKKKKVEKYICVFLSLFIIY